MCPCVKWLKLTYLLMMLYFRKYFKTCNFKLTCNLCSLVAFAACVQCETIKTDATFFCSWRFLQFLVHAFLHYRLWAKCGHLIQRRQIYTFLTFYNASSWCYTISDNLNFLVRWLCCYMFYVLFERGTIGPLCYS